MATVSHLARVPTATAEVADLHSGDRMTQAEFHRAYRNTPEGFKAELIGGIVFVASPVSRRHGRPSGMLMTSVGYYACRTPGVEPFDNTTVILGDQNEPQPDVMLRILPGFGGRSAETPNGDYVTGPPELVIEVAYASQSIDLHRKRREYRAAGIPEYLVWVVRDGRFVWFDLVKDVERPVSADGIVRSQMFPGLWIDTEAVRGADDARLLATLNAGLATPEHAAFVASLAAAKR